MDCGGRWRSRLDYDEVENALLEETPQDGEDSTYETLNGIETLHFVRFISIRLFPLYSWYFFWCLLCAFILVGQEEAAGSQEDDTIE